MNITDYFNIPKVYYERDLLKLLHNEEEDYVQQIFIKIYDIKAMLSTFIKNVVIVPTPMEKNGYYNSDYVYSFLGDKFNDEEDYIHFNIYIADNKIDKNTNITISFSDLDVDRKKRILELFRKYLPNNYSWNGKNYSKMIIYYIKKNPLEKALEALENPLENTLEENPLEENTLEENPLEENTLENLENHNLKTNDYLPNIILIFSLKDIEYTHDVDITIIQEITAKLEKYGDVNFYYDESNITLTLYMDDADKVNNINNIIEICKNYSNTNECISNFEYIVNKINNK